MIPFRIEKTPVFLQTRTLAWFVWTLWCAIATPHLHAQTPLPEFPQLTIEGDVAAQLVDGVDRFLLKQIEKSASSRTQFWNRDLSSPANYASSISKNREALAKILGVRDQRVSFDAPEVVAAVGDAHRLTETSKYDVYAIRWPAIDGLSGEGLLLQPRTAPVAHFVVLPDAGQTPEMMAGLQAGVAASSQVARRLAEAGCRVVVPTLIDRTYEARNGRAKMTHREFIYRSAYELGRHLIGYELQKTFAAIDWFEKNSGGQPQYIGVIGYGEGGTLALYAAALDQRIDATLISGSFAPQEAIWQQPIDRNVFGLLEQFGAAEIATMVVPRKLIIQSTSWPAVNLPSEGGAPGVLVTPTDEVVQAEFQRAQTLISQANGPGELANALRYFATPPDSNTLFTEESLHDLLVECGALSVDGKLSDERPAVALRGVDPVARQLRQVAEADRVNQRLLAVCENERRSFFNIGLPQYDAPEGSNKVDTSSLSAYQSSVERFREIFRKEVIGQFDPSMMLPPNPHVRKTYDGPNWTGYEVTLDVFPDVFAYGILCVPKVLPVGEKRPVVVCQHGLEGRPQDVVAGDHPAYHDFAAKLAELGYVTFAPQNLYIGQDRFRTLQRKAYPLKKTLFSIIVPQHQQIASWLASLPFVDPQRIAFYGLSYGGKSAMRIPPLVPEYCLSICSADFNDWVWKNASTQSSYSYVWTGEYEIFEFDLGTRFNYAEMAALIAPRPFMVERGHFDGVAPDDRVAAEFAKVQHLYSARLGIPDRCQIEFFVGPHTINGKGTFEFLHKHLQWRPPQP